MTDVADRGDVQTLDAVTVRVRAANPSAMTLTGTNTYVVGPAGGAVVVVDPGPALDAHRRAIERAVADRAARVVAVLVTHHHHDHAEAVGWAAAWGAPARAFDPGRVPGTEPLSDGDIIDVGATTLVAHHHPGHTSDHVCVQVSGTGVVLTGDHVLGDGTSVIAWPDGDLGDYLRSLQALRDLAPGALYPGHGGVIDDPVGRIDALAAHRVERTTQILAALSRGASSVEAIVAVVYAELPSQLRPAAARSVRAHLSDLERQGHVTRRNERWHAG